MRDTPVGRQCANNSSGVKLAGFISSFLKPLIHHDGLDREIDYRAIRNYLLFNYNPGLNTFVKEVKKVRPGHTLVL